MTGLMVKVVKVNPPFSVEPQNNFECNLESNSKTGLNLHHFHHYGEASTGMTILDPHAPRVLATEHWTSCPMHGTPKHYVFQQLTGLSESSNYGEFHGNSLRKRWRNDAKCCE